MSCRELAYLGQCEVVASGRHNWHADRLNIPGLLEVGPQSQLQMLGLLLILARVECAIQVCENQLHVAKVNCVVSLSPCAEPLVKALKQRLDAWHYLQTAVTDKQTSGDERQTTGIWRSYCDTD